MVRRRSETTAAPEAVRLSPARFTDVRLWGGALLLLAAAVAGALLAGSGGETTLVWRAAADLPVGSVPRDVVAVEVPRTVADEAYARPGDDLAGVLRWPVSAGELLPRAALTRPGAEPTRRVTVPVDPMHAPTGLREGDLVDVWAVPRPDAGNMAGAPTLVLPEARVAIVTPDASGFGGEVAVALEVPLDAVPGVVSAGHAGLLDLVAVPLSSQEVAS